MKVDKPYSGNLYCKKHCKEKKKNLPQKYCANLCSKATGLQFLTPRDFSTAGSRNKGRGKVTVSFAK